MEKSVRAETFKKLYHERASEIRDKRNEELRLAELKRNAHVQGCWTMVEHTRIERPISGFYLDDLGRELGLVLGDNDSWKPPRKNCLLEVDFFAYVIVTFFVGGEDEKRIRGIRYRLNTDYVKPNPLLMEEDILGGQGRQGSVDEWVKTRLQVPRSGEEMFDPKNYQKITAIAIDNSPLCRVPITNPSETTIGANARYLAIGTNHSRVYAYNIRGDPIRRTSDIMSPLRICKLTNSPSITCLAIHSLAIIAGGSNGGVVVFDLLGSIQQPVRKLVQASTPADKKKYIEAMREHGYTREETEEPWAELVKATAVAVDPSPDVWRGAVAIGSHILYWDETECLRWQLGDDVAGRKKLEEAAKIKAETEAEKLKKNLKPRKPFLVESVVEKIFTRWSQGVTWE